jgi:ribosome recycling factor
LQAALGKDIGTVVGELKMTIKEIYAGHEEKMQKALDALRKEYATLRAGRATTSLLDKIAVDYYGTPTPVNQVANISVPEPRMIVIQPWEKNMLSAIEKAIMKSDLGLSPNSDGTVIRLNIPQLTQQRRTELVKVVHKKSEEARVAIRNLRRDANEAVKKAEKDKTISEDEAKKGQDDMQKLTDKYIKEVDKVMAAKEKEIMEV